MAAERKLSSPQSFLTGGCLVRGTFVLVSY
jgi:hypothetical protein